jgi:hypothetical protein
MKGTAKGCEMSDNTRADLRAASMLVGDILAESADEAIAQRVREEQARRQEAQAQRHARGWFLVAELVEMHARQRGWTAEMEAGLREKARMAAGDGSLPVREFPEGFPEPAESTLRWCELSDFNDWLVKRKVKPLTLPQDAPGAPVDAEALRPWLEYPTWDIREGLLLLAGIDPHRSKDINSNEDCTAFEASPPPGTLVGGPAWGRIGYPQRAEVGADGVPRLVNGPVFSLDDHGMLWKLMEHWHRTPAHNGMTRATPAHFIGWAESAGMAPHWLGAVRCAGYLPSAPAVAAPEPVRFADLPRVMAEAMHADPMARAGARINLEAELVEMVASGRLKVRDSLTHGPLPYPVGDALKNAVLLPDEVRQLLAERGVSLPAVAVPEPVAQPGKAETQEMRQARRYQACIDAKLPMPTDTYAHMPRGIGQLAKREGVTRQAFTEDVKAHIGRLHGR